MDIYPQQRKSKREMQRKRAFRVYKHGGKLRTINITKGKKK